MGSYNASTGTWTKGADYSLTETSRNTYRVTGEIPYGDADAVFPTAGNRFAVRIVNKNITSKSQLPSGVICKTTNTEAAGGYNKSTKSAFEDDGSLIAIFSPTAETKNAYNREVKIEWEGDGVFVTYTFNLTNATLESAPQPAPAGLTEFRDGQTVSGIDFGNAANGETSAVMDAFLAGLTYEEGQAILMSGDAVGTGDDVFLAAAFLENVHALIYANSVTEEQIVVYSDVDDGDFGDKGWKNLTNGKYTVETSFVVGTIYDTTPPVWNGVLIGAVLAE